MRRLFSVLFFLAFTLVACSDAAGTTSLPPTPTFSPQMVHGKQVFTRECASCHSLSPDTVIVGPSLAGIATVAETRVAEQDAYTYMMISILAPGDYVVDGFADLMPSNFGKKLAGEEIDAVVAYLMTLE